MSQISSRLAPKVDRVDQRWTGCRSSDSYLILAVCLIWTVWTEIQYRSKSLFFPRSAKRACVDKAPSSTLCSGKPGPSGPLRLNRLTSEGKPENSAGPLTGPGTDLQSTAQSEGPGFSCAALRQPVGRSRWQAVCHRCGDGIDLRDHQSAPLACPGCGATT